ncbi:hypothetical protein [Lysobacter sp. A3-1-A15]|uniref:hypothetical protein n=1 Tax=Novilysobacter viscosus TaxID=3098602 RepID=UPI002EDB3D3D
MADGNGYTKQAGVQEQGADPTQVLHDRHFLDITWDSSTLPTGAKNRLRKIDRCSWAMRGLFDMLQRDAYMRSDAEQLEREYHGLAATDRESIQLAMGELLDRVDKLMGDLRDERFK